MPCAVYPSSTSILLPRHSQQQVSGRSLLNSSGCDRRKAIDGAERHEALTSVNPQHRNSLGFANFRDDQPQRDRPHHAQRIGLRNSTKREEEQRRGERASHRFRPSGAPGQMTGPENAAGAQSGAREFRLSEHSPSQRSDCPPDCCPEPKRQEQDHDQSWPFIHPRMGSTLLKRSDRRPIVCGVCGPGQNFALQHFPLPPSLISHWLMIYSGASKRRPQIALSWRATTACVGLSFGAGNLAIGQARAPFHQPSSWTRSTATA